VGFYDCARDDGCSEGGSLVLGLGDVWRDDEGWSDTYKCYILWLGSSISLDSRSIVRCSSETRDRLASSLSSGIRVGQRVRRPELLLSG